MKRILLLETLFDDKTARECCTVDDTVELVHLADSSDERTTSALRDADALVISYKKVTRDMIDSMKNCRVIVRTGIGVDNVDVDAATQRGIMVANVPDYCLEEVADHAMALMLACTRKIVSLNRSAERKEWTLADSLSIFRLRTLVLGLYGFGNIARMVAIRAKSFGMSVSAFDPFVSRKDMAEKGVEKAESLTDLAAGCDVLSVHVPLNAATRDTVNESVFKTMKPTAFLINTARGGIVDETALTLALEGGLITGAGLDVLVNENLKTNTLSKMKNVIITPHAAYYSEESNKELIAKSILQAIEAVSGGTPRYVINKSALKPAKED